MKRLSDRLKEERLAAKLTQEQIADAAKVTKQAISKLEGPQGSKNPNAYTLERISRLQASLQEQSFAQSDCDREAEAELKRQQQQQSAQKEMAVKPSTDAGNTQPTPN